VIEASIHAVQKNGPLQRFYQKVQRKKGGKVAKVATARRLLEWIYHMMKDAKAFYQVEEAAESRDRGEPANCPGTVL
jgi:hypothetical protein